MSTSRGGSLIIHTSAHYSMEGLGFHSSSSSAGELSSSVSPPTVTSPCYRDNSSSSPIKEEPTTPRIEDLGDENEDNFGGRSSLKRESLEVKRESQGSLPTQTKRPRGRPRIHPRPMPGEEVKAPNKGRSKTGCKTCRRRKKKCDEGKPECYNCMRNGLHCEGYEAKRYWQSARERDSTLIIKHEIPKLPVLIDGIETEVDRRLLDHYVQDLSRKLSLYNEHQNPFTKLFLPLVVEHRGLMHAVLALSGSHLCRFDSTVENSRKYHQTKAFGHLQMEIDAAKVHTNTGTQLQIAVAGPKVNDALVAMLFVLTLDCICLGQIHGEYGQYLDFVKYTVGVQDSDNLEFSRFMHEFFLYHEVLNCITNKNRRPLVHPETYFPPGYYHQHSEMGIFVGVRDGLFTHISRITALRDSIRHKKANGIHPTIDYEVLPKSVQLDADIRGWVPSDPPDTHRYIAARLFQQCAWLYLSRTIHPSEPNTKIEDAVNEALKFLNLLPDMQAEMSTLLMPLFILGCSAFNPGQRPEIDTWFDKLINYSGLGNIARTREVVHKIWNLMDDGDETSWDWESILEDMGYDFLVT